MTDRVKLLSTFLFFYKHRLGIKKYLRYVKHNYKGFILLYCLTYFTNYLVVFVCFTFIFNDVEKKYIRKSLVDIAYGRGQFKDTGGRREPMINMINNCYNNRFK